MLLSDHFEERKWAKSGIWTPDTQAAWFAGSIRAVPGGGGDAAYLRGPAVDSTLTLSNAIDMSSLGSAVLTYSWFIEAEVGAGEYMALDFFDDVSWHEITSLNGEGEPDNAWLHERIQVAPEYLHSNFKIRFRGTLSTIGESIHVDDVKLRGGPTNHFIPASLFSDSFDDPQQGVAWATGYLPGQNGYPGSPGEWNGKWLEDSQNDFFVSNQRASDGSKSAEVDGYANNAMLTIGRPIDMSHFQTAELSFDWYIESRFDSGEYLRLEFLDQFGNWDTILSLDGNQDAENTWHNELVTISDSQYLHDDFRFRIKAKASRSNEDANVDNVQLVATSMVQPPNGAPVASADGVYSVDEDGVLTVAATQGVLANDSDPNGDSLTVQLDSGPTNGSLVLNPEGSFTYTPAPNFHGNAIFTYRAFDGMQTSNVATVSIVVNSINDAPVATDDLVSPGAAEDAPFAFGASGLLTNDIDVDPSDNLMISSFTQPSHGTLVKELQGHANVIAESTFDSDLDCWTTNAIPDVSSQLTGGNPGGHLQFTDISNGAGYAIAPGKFLGNWSSFNGTGRLEFDESIFATGENIESFAPHVVTIIGSGGRATWTGSTPKDVTPWETFVIPISESSWTVESGNWNDLLNSIGELRIQLEHVYQTTGNGPRDLSGLDNVRILNFPKIFTYIPNANYNGMDSFAYAVSDGNGGTDTATVSQVDDAGSFGGDLSASANEDTPAAGTATFTDESDGFNSPNFTLGSSASSGIAAISSNGNWNYTPNANFHGTDDFVVSVTDDDGNIESQAISISVASTNDAPSISSSPVISGSENELYAYDVDATDPDVGDTLTFSLDAAPAGTTIDANSGLIQWTPTGAQVGSNNVTVRSQDAGGLYTTPKALASPSAKPITRQASRHPP